VKRPNSRDNTIMRLLPVALALACAASGQSILQPSQIPKMAKFFEPRPDEKRLECEVKPVPAQLNFSFRIQSGYRVRLPMKQFLGAGHALALASRVTPEGRDPVYLLTGIRMPIVPKNKVDWDLGGFFLLGEGRYRVDFLIADDTNRVCRKSWNVEVKLDARERSMNLGMAPGVVGEVSLRRWSAQNPETDVHRIPRLTVLLHAAPIITRMTRLRAQDRAILLGSLVALLESLPAHSVRLVVFNLDQQKELFRQNLLTPEAFEPLTQSMNNLQLQLVDFRVLQNREGHISLLADLVNQELSAKDPSDAVIFLGPTARYFDKFPDLVAEARAGSRFFYIQYKPNWDRGQDFPDSIDFAVKKLRGKTIRVHNPDEFAKAIQQIDTQMSAANDR
jgi:hypothetical protein